MTLQVTELVGAVSMLYGMLLHQGAPPRGTPPPPLPRHVTNVALATVHFLTRIAELDLDTFQVSRRACLPPDLPRQCMAH